MADKAIPKDSNCIKGAALASCCIPSIHLPFSGDLGARKNHEVATAAQLGGALRVPRQVSLGDMPHKQLPGGDISFPFAACGITSLSAVSSFSLLPSHKSSLFNCLRSPLLCPFGDTAPQRWLTA